MASLLYYLISPGGALLVFLGGAVWISCQPRSTRARRVVVWAAVAYTLAGTYAVPAAVNRLWTSGLHRFDAFDAPRRPAAIVLLGAGETRVAGWSEQVPAMIPVETARVLEAWRVYKAIAPDWIVSSGGGSSRNQGAQPSSTVMRDALVRLGVPPSRILLESSSFDTHDEAVLIAPMLRARGVEQIVLVTSAVHMPRSLGAFRAADMNPVPAIAPDPDSFRPIGDRYLPSIHGLEFSSQLAHEVVGLPYYWSRGWWRR
jgi:uncharacterized SAM-binding protein YcdF (DUF218 family)